MANPDFKIASEQTQQNGRSITVFNLRGWLDAQGENTLISTVQDAEAQGAKHLVLNMADIEMLTSAGIRALQKLYKQYTPSEGSPTVHLRLCSAQPQVYRVLSLTGFLQTMPMYETLQSALISFES